MAGAPGNSSDSYEDSSFPENYYAAMTILEVVMATGIIAVTGGGMISSINYGLWVMRMARENQRATQVMLEKLEAIRLYNWTRSPITGYVPRPSLHAYDPTSSSVSRHDLLRHLVHLEPRRFVGTTPNYSSSIRQFTVSVSAGPI